MSKSSSMNVRKLYIVNDGVNDVDMLLVSCLLNPMDYAVTKGRCGSAEFKSVGAAEALFMMFNRADVDLRMVDIRGAYDELVVTIGGCKLRLDYDEALKLAYELLEWSIIGLKVSLIYADEYGR